VHSKDDEAIDRSHPLTARIVADLEASRLVPLEHSAGDWVRALDDPLLARLGVVVERVLVDEARQSELADAVGCLAYLLFLESGAGSASIPLDRLDHYFGALRLLVSVETMRRSGLIERWTGRLGDGESEEICVQLTEQGCAAVRSPWLN
jgi:hypothetical protein